MSKFKVSVAWLGVNGVFSRFEEYMADYYAKIEKTKTKLVDKRKIKDELQKEFLSNFAQSTGDKKSMKGSREIKDDLSGGGSNEGGENLASQITKDEIESNDHERSEVEGVVKTCSVRGETVAEEADNSGGSDVVVAISEFPSEKNNQAFGKFLKQAFNKIEHPIINGCSSCGEGGKEKEKEKEEGKAGDVGGELKGLISLNKGDMSNAIIGCGYEFGKIRINDHILTLSGNGTVFSEYWKKRAEFVLSVVDSDDGKPYPFYENIDSSEKGICSQMIGICFTYLMANEWIKASGREIKAFVHFGLFVKSIINLDSGVCDWVKGRFDDASPDYVLVDSCFDFHLFESKGGSSSYKSGAVFHGLEQLESAKTLQITFDGIVGKKSAASSGVVFSRFEAGKDVEVSFYDPPLKSDVESIDPPVCKISLDLVSALSICERWHLWKVLPDYPDFSGESGKDWKLFGDIGVYMPGDMIENLNNLLEAYDIMRSCVINSPIGYDVGERENLWHWRDLYSGNPMENPLIGGNVPLIVFFILAANYERGKFDIRMYNNSNFSRRYFALDKAASRYFEIFFDDPDGQGEMGKLIERIRSIDLDGILGYLVDTEDELYSFSCPDWKFHLMKLVANEESSQEDRWTRFVIPILISKDIEEFLRLCIKYLEVANILERVGKDLNDRVDALRVRNPEMQFEVFANEFMTAKSSKRRNQNG